MKINKLSKRLEQLRKEDERHRKKINKLFDELEEITEVNFGGLLE